MSITKPTDTATIEEWVAYADAQQEIASATPCGVNDCDGDAHDYLSEFDAWSHRVVNARFDSNAVELVIYMNADGTASGNIAMESSGDVTAAELRADAARYEAFPAFLRQMADRLDALNGVKA